MEVNGYEEGDELKDLGPFTVNQAMKRNDWPMFEEAINVKKFWTSETRYLQIRRGRVCF